jgi:hypothetical protein
MSYSTSYHDKRMSRCSSYRFGTMTSQIHATKMMTTKMMTSHCDR